MFRRSRFVLALASAALLAVAACGNSKDSAAGASGKGAHAGWPSTITIGAVPSENATALMASLAPIQQLIKDKLGIDAKVFSGTSYSALIEAQKSGKVDLVEYGPFSFYIAQNQGVKLQNLGIVTNAANSDGGYYSLGETASKNKNIKSIKDFAGKKTCFVDPASTSGYLYPSYGLLQAGINPTTGVTPVFAGGHDSSVLSIAKGTCQVGFSEDSMPPQLEKAGQLAKNAIKVVWKSPEIPGSPIAASTSLPKSLRTQLENVLVHDANAKALAKSGYCSSESECQKKIGFWGYAPPSVANFGQIATICKATKSSSCTNAG
jgi:phosphonate transport system substrate-binding protein